MPLLKESKDKYGIVATYDFIGYTIRGIGDNITARSYSDSARQLYLALKDSSSAVWAMVNVMPNADFDAVEKNNKIVFFTGGGVVKNKFDIYDVTTNTWSAGVLPLEIPLASIISVNGTIYVAGGYVNGVFFNQVWKLEF